MDRFKGIFPALVTPYRADGSVDTGALGMLVERLLSQGVKGFYVDGSTGEAFLLTPEERRTVIETAAEYTAGRATLIAQIGCISTRQSIELAQFAQACGYDAVSSVAPFYYKFSFAEIKKYYYDIADAVDIPMIVYNIPVLSGVSLSVSQMAELLGDPRFIGVKHTSTDYFALRQFKTAFPDKVIFNGFDETFLAGLSMGADGAIGSTYNFMADRFIKIYNDFKAGRMEDAMRGQAEADRIIEVLCRYGVMQAEKAILTKLGIPVGEPRAPFIGLSQKKRQALFGELTTLMAL